MRRPPLLVAALPWLLLDGAADATVSNPDFEETVFVASPDLSGATGLAWAPDGSNRLFVIRKGGEVRIIKDGTLLPTPFATVTPIYTVNECGLVGIAIDPAFATTHHVYLFVTVSGTEQQIIRYTEAADVGGDKTIIVPGLPTAGANHDGGALAIGPDNHLYWAIGDLGNGTGVDADLGSLAAKVGRAQLNGAAPIDNPFHDGAGPNNDHIWARGFRNPFTMTFEPGTGRLWLNVVGSGFEQIFVVGRGDHAGWNDYENDQPSGFLAPVFAYGTNQTELGGCVTGGCFYDGSAFPSEYRGDFFFGDHNAGRILRAQVNAAGGVDGVETFATNVGNAVDVTTGPDGALYYVGVTNETIFRTRYIGTDVDPPPDAAAPGGADAAGGVDPVVDARTSGADDPQGLSGGCGCRLGRARHGASWLPLALVAVVATRRRIRRGGTRSVRRLE